MPSEPAGLQRVAQIFEAALDFQGADRARYVAETCQGDEALHAHVQALLAAHERGREFLPLSDASAVTESGTTEAAAPAHHEEAGAVIGRYKLLQRIGEGGFGTVYMAEQREPVIRRVALKIIKPGMDTRQVIARFEAERQALAMMDHPHIVSAISQNRPLIIT